MIDALSGVAAQWPSAADRLEIQGKLSAMLAEFTDSVSEGAVAPAVSPESLRARLSRFDFRQPMAMLDASEAVIDMLKTANVHMMHAGYFGLFNPSVVFPGVLADQISAQINPQLAVWSHAPAAVEIERHTVAAVGGLVGWTPQETSGHFTSGGAEANYTAVLLALTKACPGYSESGASAFEATPRIYVSAESHLAWLKIAHQAGVGRDAVRLIPTDGMGRMNVAALQAAIAGDAAAGDVPVLVAATAGTTNAGMIDPLPDCKRITRANRMWFHVDAAWGGAGMLDPESARHLHGIELADSITLDAHKWFAVPMGAGIFLCRDETLLGETFRVDASYMPGTTEATVDPYTHSVQWSRRFIGLKLFMTLACMGWSGYRAHIAHALSMAERLKSLLRENDWRIVNDSPLAVLCFVDDRERAVPAVTADDVVRSGRAWISQAKFEGASVLRACITSHFTGEQHLTALIEELNRSRDAQ